MKQRINRRYCPSCGGLQSYEEDDPTQGAGIGIRTRIEVRPDPVAPYATAANTTYEERVCGCQR